MPTKKGFHVLYCSSYYQPGNKNHWYVFGNNITNNNTKGGLNIMGKQIDDQCHNNTDDGKDVTNIIPDDGIDTIKKSEKIFSVKDKKKAHRTRQFQNVGGHPSDATIVYSAVTNGVKNSPITQRDMKLALDMLGKSAFGVQGKKIQHQPDAVDVESLESILPIIIQKED